MKTTFYPFAMFLAITFAVAQPSTEPLHEWTATVVATDETGQPVAGAEVSIRYPGSPASNQTERWKHIQGQTDTNGMFRASHPNDHFNQLSFRATKTGHYSVSCGYELGFNYNWERWNPTIELLLKKIRRPIPMYAKRIWGNPPVTNRPVGFDLSAGDWIAPYGKGQNSDIIFGRSLNMESRRNYDEKLVISFPNNGDGIQEFKVPDNQRYCGLLSPHDVPVEGYQPQIVRRTSEHPGRFMTMDYDAKRNYFFRVRTVLNQKGDVESALYGKIYGDFMHFTYYLNPNPNDRNIEFNPKRNLIPGQNVTAP